MPRGCADCSAILVCVPTPLGQHREPDLSYVTAAAETAIANLAPGALLVLESTTWPGTTREVLAPMLEAAGRTVGEDAYLAFSPERVDPGNTRWSMRETPKVVGGLTPACAARAEALYARICDRVHPVSSPESAEMAKIIENTFRAVNIALVNEMAILADRMGIDVWEAIEASATKPFGFMPFWPGPGLGGHCIPVDPFYLAWRARAFDLDSEFVELAGRINVSMPYYAVSRIARALNARGKAVRGAGILLLGMAYKADVGDLRESPSLKLLELLRAEGGRVELPRPACREPARGGPLLRAAGRGDPRGSRLRRHRHRPCRAGPGAGGGARRPRRGPPQRRAPAALRWCLRERAAERRRPLGSRHPP